MDVKQRHGTFCRLCRTVITERDDHAIYKHDGDPVVNAFMPVVETVNSGFWSLPSTGRCPDGHHEFSFEGETQDGTGFKECESCVAIAFDSNPIVAYKKL